MSRLVAAHLALMLFLIGAAPSAWAQTLFLDEQFGFTQTTEIYATKPVGMPATGMDLLLELFQPSGAGVPAERPGLILIHGGGFTGGSRFDARLTALCTRMARRGWTCVSIAYRLDGDDPVIDPAFAPIEAAALAAGSTVATAIAAAAEDAWASRQWMVANAGTLGVDVTRIGIGGSSAGAVTSLITAYSLDPLGIAPKKPFRAVLDMWGTLGDDPTEIDALDAPLFITHGAADMVVPVSAAEALEAQAAFVGLSYESHIFPGVGHGFDIFSREVAPGITVFDRIASFVYFHVALGSGVIVPASSPAAMTGLGLALALFGSRILLRRRQKR